MSIVKASQRIDQLEWAVRQVNDIHQPYGTYVQHCQVCQVQWPCNTNRVLASLRLDDE